MEDEVAMRGTTVKAMASWPNSSNKEEARTSFILMLLVGNFLCDQNTNEMNENTVDPIHHSEFQKENLVADTNNFRSAF